MKLRTLLTLAFMALVAPMALAQNYVYLGDIPIPGNESPGAVALTNNGDVYIGTFNAASSNLLYVQGALAGIVNDTYTVDFVSTETLPAGRGLNDIEVDASGNVYIAGTGSAAADTVFKKFGPAPSHTPAWSIVDTRINGIELMDANTIAVGQAFSAIKFKNTSDGLDKPLPNSITPVGVNYIRGLALNTTNNDLYASKNGNSELSALKIFSGGTPAAYSTYALAADQLLSPLGVGTTFGVATQAVDFDGINNWLLIADAYDQNLVDTNEGVRIYAVSGTGAATVLTAGTFIAGRNPGYDYGNVYGISYNRINSRDYVALAVMHDNDPITNPGGEVYTIDLWGIPFAGVTDWELFN